MFITYTWVNVEFLFFILDNLNQPKNIFENWDMYIYSKNIKRGNPTLKEKQN